MVELATTSPGRAWPRQPSGRIEKKGAAIPLMVAVEKGAIQGINADRGAPRIVVVGDSYFLVNNNIQAEANRDFARNAVNWLVSRELLVQGIETRSVKEYRITMTGREMTVVRWLFIVGFPGSVLFAGFLVWLRRRRIVGRTRDAHTNDPHPNPLPSDGRGCRPSPQPSPIRWAREPATIRRHT